MTNPHELAAVAWKVKRKVGDLVEMVRPGESGWWHVHANEEDFGGNPCDDRGDLPGVMECRTCGRQFQKLKRKHK